MDEEGMSYDSDAMENVHALLTSANSNLTLASDSYTSDALTGSNLVEEVEEFMEKFRKRLLYAYSAISNIKNEDVSSNFDYSSGKINSFEKQENDSYLEILFALHEMNELTTKGEKAYEWEMCSNFTMDELYHIGVLTDSMITTYDEVLDDIYNNFDVLYLPAKEYADEKKKELNDASLSNLAFKKGLTIQDDKILTPDEYEKALRNSAPPGCDYEILENNIRKYTENYNSEEVTQAIQTYEEAKIEYAEALEGLSGFEGLKYTITQQKKEIPYYRIRVSDEYKEFQLNKSSDFIKQTTGYENVEALCNNSLIGFNNTSSEIYLTDDDKDMLEYIIYTDLKENEIFTWEDTGDECLKYLGAIEDKINRRCGAYQAVKAIEEMFDENGKLKTNADNIMKAALEEGFPDGLIGFCDGLGNVFNAKGIMSDTQYKQMYFLQMLEGYDLLALAYKNGLALGGMSIPIVASAATTFLTGDPKIGQRTAAVLMGVSSIGSSTNQGLIDRIFIN